VLQLGLELEEQATIPTVILWQYGTIRMNFTYGRAKNHAIDVGPLKRMVVGRERMRSVRSDSVFICVIFFRMIDNLSL
jgi:hypothetical protein